VGIDKDDERNLVRIKKNLHNNIHKSPYPEGVNNIICASNSIILKLKTKKVKISDKLSKKIRYNYVCASLKGLKTLIKGANAVSRG